MLTSRNALWFAIDIGDRFVSCVSLSGRSIHLCSTSYLPAHPVQQFIGENCAAQNDEQIRRRIDSRKGIEIIEDILHRDIDRIVGRISRRRRQTKLVGAVTSNESCGSIPIVKRVKILQHRVVRAGGIE